MLTGVKRPTHRVAGSISHRRHSRRCAGVADLNILGLLQRYQLGDVRRLSLYLHPGKTVTALRLAGVSATLVVSRAVKGHVADKLTVMKAINADKQALEDNHDKKGFCPAPARTEVMRRRRVINASIEEVKRGLKEG